VGSDDQTLVSVIIPTLNAGQRFSELLKAIESQQLPGSIEVVVIDSGSRDGTPELANTFGASVLSIPRHRFNHGRARNEAIRAARGEFIALTVQDAVPVGRDWLAHLLSPLLSQPEMAGSYGLQVAPPWAGLPARARNSAWRKSDSGPVVRCIDSEDQFQQMTPQERLALIRFDNVTSCIRRSVWEQLSFPERRYGEDMAWAKRVLLAGYKIAHVPSATVWHYHERGWLYTLRRAYVDGYMRVELVDWPSPDLALQEVYAALRMMISYLSSEEFDSMTDPVAIRRFLREETREPEPSISVTPDRLYRAALDFSWALLENAVRCSADDALPPGVWTELLRFAIVSEVGKDVGAAAATKQTERLSFERIAWSLVHLSLGRGV
jgi:rhamnosyltransferase